MATRRQRERKARQRAWHNEIDHTPTGLPLIGVWFDEPSWVEDKEQTWGLDYRQRVLGEWLVDELLPENESHITPHHVHIGSS